MYKRKNKHDRIKQYDNIVDIKQNDKVYNFIPNLKFIQSFYKIKNQILTILDQQRSEMIKQFAEHSVKINKIIDSSKAFIKNIFIIFLKKKNVFVKKEVLEFLIEICDSQIKLQNIQVEFFEYIFGLRKRMKSKDRISKEANKMSFLKKGILRFIVLYNIVTFFLLRKKYKYCSRFLKNVFYSS